MRQYLYIEPFFDQDGFMFSKRTQIAPSATAIISGLVQDLKRQGHFIYNLSLGEPNIPNDLVVQKAAHEAIEKNQNFYPPSTGFEVLREATCEWINTSYGTCFETKNVLVTSGGKFGISLSLQALLEPSDEVVLVAPYWVSYPSMIQLFEGQAKVIRSEEKNGWKIGPEELRAACTEKTKLFILNNGCNPTGALYTREELAALLAALPKDCWILSDEVYSGLTYDGTYVSCGEFSEYADRLILVQSCSKNFGMTGWRLGFVLAPAALIDVLVKLQGQSITSPSALSQWAALAAVQNGPRIQDEMCRTLHERRDFFIDGLAAHFGPLSKPPSALYTFIKLSYFGVSHEDDIRFCKELLEQAHIAMIPGSAFGYSGYVRCAFGETPEHLEKCIQALATHLKS